MTSTTDLYRAILTELGEAELQRVKILIGSETLRRAIFLAVFASLGQASLIVPHYWAVYYHDGRGAITPHTASKLVFFDDPLVNDPRLFGAYPQRADELVRLTREQYEFGLEQNAERRARGLPPFMFVLDRVGPSRPRPFFEQLARNAANRATPIVLKHFDKYVQELVDTDPDLRAETDEAEFGI